MIAVGVVPTCRVIEDEHDTEAAQAALCVLTVPGSERAGVRADDRHRGAIDLETTLSCRALRPVLHLEIGLGTLTRSSRMTSGLEPRCQMAGREGLKPGHPGRSAGSPGTC
jgi:hypothetical protein